MLCMARALIVKLLHGPVHWGKKTAPHSCEHDLRYYNEDGVLSQLPVWCNHCLYFVHIISWMVHFLPTFCQNCFFFFSITISHTLLALCKHCLFVVLILSQLPGCYTLIVTIAHFLLTNCHNCLIITCDNAGMGIFKLVY